MTSKIPTGDCPQCGAPNPYENQACTRCGATLPWTRAQEGVAVEEDKPSVLLNTFSFIIPVVGIAAWLILMGSEPEKSREAGISALLGILVAPFVLFVVMPLLMGR